MKILHRTTRIMPAVMIAFCTAGILVGSASAASASSVTKTQRQQNWEARYEQQLARSVTAGKLTSAQEQTVLNEHNLLKGQLEAATASNRKQVQTQVKQEAKTWSQQQSISTHWLWLHRHRSHKI